MVSGYDTHKLLGVAALPSKCNKTAGKLISEEVKLLLDRWKCMDRIASVVFDTTANNFGHVTAACVSLQMGRPHLWSACHKLIVCKEKVTITGFFARHLAIFCGFLLVHVFLRSQLFKSPAG